MSVRERVVLIGYLIVVLSADERLQVRVIRTKVTDLVIVVGGGD